MNRKISPLVAVLLGLLLSLALISGCGKSKTKRAAGGKTEIVFWHSYVAFTQPALKKLVARFESEHPGIKVRAQYVPTGDQLLQKLTTAVKTETAPDVCWVHDSWIGPLSEQNHIYDLEELARQYGGFTEEDKKDFFPAALATGHYQGKLRMMPMEATSMALAYNKDLFRQAGLDPEKPPKTWAELVEYGKRLTIRKGDRVEQWAIFIPVFTGQLASYAVWQYNIFLWGEGGSYADPSGKKVTFNSDAGVRALQYWVDLQHKYKIGSMNTPEQGFESQRVAMSLMGSWDLPHMKDMTFDWGVAPIPAGSKRQVSPLGGEYLVIFRQTEHPKEAWEFVRWFVSPEIQEWWSLESKYLPVRWSALDSPTYQEALKSDPGLKVYAEQMRNAYAEPILPQASEIDLYLATALEKAVRKVATPKAALDEAAAKANAALARSK